MAVVGVTERVQDKKAGTDAELETTPTVSRTEKQFLLPNPRRPRVKRSAVRLAVAGVAAVRKRGGAGGAEAAAKRARRSHPNENVVRHKDS